MRPLCICGQRPAAINYSKNGKTYYRKKCESCNKYGTVGKGIPQWKLDGYEKKTLVKSADLKVNIKSNLMSFI